MRFPRKALDLALKTESGVLPNPGWRRPRGSPRCTWVDHVKEDTAAPLDSLICLAADRQDKPGEVSVTVLCRPRVHDEDERCLF